MSLYPVYMYETVLIHTLHTAWMLRTRCNNLKKKKKVLKMVTIMQWVKMGKIE